MFSRYGGGFKDEETIIALLNKDLMSLQLKNSVTSDYLVRNVSEKCANLRELVFGGAYCSISDVGMILFTHNWIS